MELSIVGHQWRPLTQIMPLKTHYLSINAGHSLFPCVWYGEKVRTSRWLAIFNQVFGPFGDSWLHHLLHCGVIRRRATSARRYVRDRGRKSRIIICPFSIDHYKNRHLHYRITSRNQIVTIPQHCFWVQNRKSRRWMMKTAWLAAWQLFAPIDLFYL